MMKTRVPSKSGGMALIVAMIAIFVFSALAAGFALSMKVEARLAHSAVAEQKFFWGGRSGVELARWSLAPQPNLPNQPYDSLQQYWAGGTGGLGMSNSAFSDVSLAHYQIDEDVWVEVTTIDLDRKININTATPDVIKQALTLMGVDANDISVVSDSILDWIDADDLPLPAGAESDYYQGLPLPYYAKNAPIDDIAELRFIKGITPEMYEGGNATNRIASAFEHKLGFGHAPGQPANYLFGLKDIFTPVSSGRINLDTVTDVNVLQSIPGVDADTAAAILKGRAGPDGVDGTEDDIPYRSLGDLGRAGIPAQAIQQLNPYCSTRSLVFEVHVTVHVSSLPPRNYVAILHRNSATDIRIVSFYWQQ
jgi:type II secretory pathway component PulK